MRLPFSSNLRIPFFAVLAVFAAPGQVFAQTTSLADFPASPASEFLSPNDASPDYGFCSRWNPEFGLKKYYCCPGRRLTKKERNCAPRRAKTSFCDEVTDDQKRWVGLVESGRMDVLKGLGIRVARDQAYCTVNDGFLAFGRRLVATPTNRIRIRNPQRCIDFGTDAMVGMLEWVGRKLHEQYAAPEYSRLRLLVGDISAPRGGCLSGRRGRRGHVSHTNGKDVDLAFIWAKPGRDTPPNFHKQFDPKPNWLFVKQLFANPYACVQVIFLDRRWISKLANAAKGDPEWYRLRSFLKHAKGHRNHFHVRIGNGPGDPGCPLGSEPLTAEDMDESGIDGEGGGSESGSIDSGADSFGD